MEAEAVGAVGEVDKAAAEELGTVAVDPAHSADEMDEAEEDDPTDVEGGKVLMVDADDTLVCLMEGLLRDSRRPISSVRSCCNPAQL
jgi:hypothetical protein